MDINAAIKLLKSRDWKVVDEGAGWYKLSFHGHMQLCRTNEVIKFASLMEG